MGSWAILLCKFKDDTSADIYPRQRFDEIFTTAGNGKANMVDFFRDVTHGRVDISGSKVFPPNGGFYTLDQNRSDYLGWNTPTHGRNALIVWGRAAAAANHDDLSAFTNVVVVTNTPADLFGSPFGVATDDGRNPDNGMSSLSVSTLGQEMLHGYGVNHARIDGSAADYMDQYDIMSTLSALMGEHPVYRERDVRGRLLFRIGPGLNAATMDAFGWLDHSRVWTASRSDSDKVIQLRPLHRRDLPGFLCVRVGPYYVEFRPNESWDAGFPAPVVLIHDYFDGHSYLYPADDGGDALGHGDTFSEGDVSSQPPPLHGDGLQISVTSIDMTNHTATIRVRRWVDQRPRVGPARTFAGMISDGGGWFLVNGRLRRVPPRSPLLAILERMADVGDGEADSTTGPRAQLREQGYREISAIAAKEGARSTTVREPAKEVRMRLAPDNQ